jgi:hypothetical protein
MLPARLALPWCYQVSHPAGAGDVVGFDVPGLIYRDSATYNRIITKKVCGSVADLCDFVRVGLDCVRTVAEFDIAVAGLLMENGSWL